MLQAIRPDVKASGSSSSGGSGNTTGGGVGMGIMAATGSGAAGGTMTMGLESALGDGGMGAGACWVRHGMELDGLDTLWDIVLNANGEGWGKGNSGVLLTIRASIVPSTRGC